MNFNQKIENYVLGNFSVNHLPEIVLTGIEEELESESLLKKRLFSNMKNIFFL